MNWYTVVLVIVGGVLSLGIGAVRIAAEYQEATWKPVGKALDWVIEFYLSLIAYFVLHLLIVTSSDFVDAFNIPPLNIGIYIDKLAAIRALLMVIADITEYLITQKDYSMQSPLKDINVSEIGQGKWIRRPGSIFSFIAMLVCRIYYLRIVYKSDNKSLSVFIVLCIEGFWFGVFQMSFFAIGPQYNAVTSLGIHTMGNFIFFGQLLMQRRAKTRPEINSIYRVRVNAWICLVTSISAFWLWISFCYAASGDDGMGPLAKKWESRLKVASSNNSEPNSGPTHPVQEYDVWSPLLLFIVGAFAEDFSVPGILPFALLDNDKAALVNYLTPLFFMSGAFVTVLVNDILQDNTNLEYYGWDWGGSSVKSDADSGRLSALAVGGHSYFKEWSISVSGDINTTDGSDAVGWHTVWLLNIPKYIAFFISMWCIHGTYGRLRCIVQSRWRVMLLTMFVVIPRATLETMGYVGVANYALARAAISSYWKDTNSGGGGIKARNPSNNKNDYSGFVMIAVHDVTAMFCRFVYGKFAIRYNSKKYQITIIVIQLDSDIAFRCDIKYRFYLR